MRIRDLQHRVHDMALGKGWWPYPVDINNNFRLSDETVATKLFRITNEVSEAGEELAANRRNVWYREDGKPEGMGIEIVDAIIRSLDLLEALGLDAEELIELKLDYNATRRHRHGGKTI